MLATLSWDEHPVVAGWLRAAAVALLLLAGAAQAGEPDLAKAEQLLKEGQAAEAAALFEQALEADPEFGWCASQLGRALYAQGEYARAGMEFESVLKFGNLPPDMQSQTEVYDKAAADYLAGRRWQPFYYAETGIGNYRRIPRAGRTSSAVPGTTIRSCPYASAAA